MPGGPTARRLAAYAQTQKKKNNAAANKFANNFIRQAVNQSIQRRKQENATFNSIPVGEVQLIKKGVPKQIYGGRRKARRATRRRRH